VALAGCDWSLHRMMEQPKCGVDQVALGGPCNREPPADTVAWQDVAAPPPPPLTRALVERGRDRYNRFCAPGHGIAGDGDSDVSRGMTLRRPPPLVDATVTGFDDARILRAMTEGYGMMPSYAALLPAADRWAVLHYVRVLQRREVALEALAPALREEAMRWLR